MGLAYDEFELTESAYRHGYDDADLGDILRQKHVIIRSRRGRLAGYEILGRNSAGEYLLAAARVVESFDVKILRVFHLNRMSSAEERRFRRMVGQ